MLDEGVYTAVSEIGGTEMINKSYVSVANARAAGTALPASWEEQRRLPPVGWRRACSSCSGADAG
jgi:hypothetical protein